MNANSTLSRKKFLSAGFFMTTGSLVTPGTCFHSATRKTCANSGDMVKEFVRLAHSDLG